MILGIFQLPRLHSSAVNGFSRRQNNRLPFWFNMLSNSFRPTAAGPVGKWNQFPRESPHLWKYKPLGTIDVDGDVSKSGDQFHTASVSTAHGSSDNE